MGFDKQGFPATWAKMRAGSSIELGDHVWLSDAFLFYPDAVVTPENQPSWTLPVPMLFDLKRMANSYQLPCGRIDLTTDNECLWMLVSMITVGIDSRGNAPALCLHRRDSVGSHHQRQIIRRCEARNETLS